MCFSLLFLVRTSERERENEIPLKVNDFNTHGLFFIIVVDSFFWRGVECLLFALLRPHSLLSFYKEKRYNFIECVCNHVYSISYIHRNEGKKERSCMKRTPIMKKINLASSSISRN